MSESQSLVLPVTGSGQRLDQFLVEQVEAVSRSRAQQLILEGHVYLLRGGRVITSKRDPRPSYRLQAGDVVHAELPAALPSTLQPEAIPLRIVYEDDDMLVLDKPAGIVVHPAPGHERGTLVQALLARYPDLPGINGTQRPGIVHRLDLNTSGLLMVAKNERAQHSLSTQLAEHRVAKGYLALVLGRFEPTRGAIDAPIGRDPVHRQRMAVTRAGRPARTRYCELGAFSGYSLVLALPESGRTHQIRVHFAAVGHAIAGDRLYGGDVELMSRQFLHAAFLRFARPSDGAWIESESSLPPDLLDVLGSVMGRGGSPESEAAVQGMLKLSYRAFREERPSLNAGERPR